MPGEIHIVDTTMDNIHLYGVCGYKSMKRPGYPEKIDWLEARFNEGMIIKTLVSDEDSAQGMIEYIPGEYCWRPVHAGGTLFIHCLFVGFKKKYKNKGYATLLLKECENDAKDLNRGIAVVTRKGSFMVDKDIFLKNGYRVVDSAPSDFELLYKSYDSEARTPRFKPGLAERQKQYADGLTVIRADQCPYTVKNVNEIRESAEKEFHIKPRIITLQNHVEAQMSPCAFGTFCILYEGQIIAEHPISNTRFKNIMTKLLA